MLELNLLILLSKQKIVQDAIKSIKKYLTIIN